MSGPPNLRRWITVLNLCEALIYILRDVMRDNMLVNLTGLKGHAMPIDLNIEHLIGELKVREFLI